MGGAGPDRSDDATRGDGADEGSTERIHLGRDVIVKAAIALVDAEGLGVLSMRRLGAELGVEAMALYRYLNGREDLLEAMVETMTSGLERASAMDLGPHGSWQAYLQRLAHGIRDLAHDHPHLFPLIATRNPVAPWIRPPLRSLEVIEDFLVTLTGCGFTDEQVVAAYRMFTSFLVGHLLLTVSQRGAALTEQTLDEGGAAAPNDTTSLVDYPTVERLSGKLAQDRSDEEFDGALEHLLDRIDALVSQ